MNARFAMNRANLTITNVPLHIPLIFLTEYHKYGKHDEKLKVSD